jgi:NADH dehydrogenase
MPEDLSLKAKAALGQLGVEVMLNTSVKNITAEGVDLGDRFLRSRSVFWAAGVKPTPASDWLEITPDPQGRVPVNEYCRVTNRDGVFVIGDVARQEENGQPLPGLAAVAKQQGQYVGRLIAQEIQGETQQGPFHYHDKGEINVIGRSYAVAKIGNIKSAGFLTWLTWCLVHIHYLANFRNKASVFSQWLWSYLTFGKGARLITTPENEKTA